MTAVGVKEAGRGRLGRQMGVRVVVVLLIAANLRVAITSVSPLLGGISQALRLSSGAASALSTIPVLCFGLVAGVALPLARRIGLVRSLGLALAVLTVGLAGRVEGSSVALFGGTIIACSGIAVCNILGPAYVKEISGKWSGVLMGLYSAALSAVAAGAAVATPTLARWLGGWRGAVGIWAALGLAGAVWITLAAWRWGSERARAGTGTVAGYRTSLSPRRWRGRGWSSVIVLTACQSLVYYSMLAWLPSVFEDKGVPTDAAGTLLSIFSIVGVPLSLALPAGVVRARRRWPYVVAVTALSAVGLLGLTFAPLSLASLWVVLIGLGQAGIYALVLTFFLTKSANPDETAQLSLLAQMAGFFVAALGPFALGEAHALTGQWRLPLALLALVLLPQLWAGVRAALPSRTTEERLDLGHAVDVNAPRPARPWR